MNVPCPYIKDWSEDGSLEPKHVASYVLMTIYIYIYIYMCVCVRVRVCVCVVLCCVVFD